MQGSSGYDVAIIGGGIVGCATLFECTRQGFSCILLEKNPDLMGEASAGNSGMLHTGFDAPPHSLEVECIKQCQKEIFPIIDKFGIPHRKCGTVLVAWTEKDKGQIPLIQHKAQQAELNIEMLDLSPVDLYKLEPNLKQGAYGALHVPDESVVDSWLLGIAYAHHALKQGAKILTNCRVDSVNDGRLYTTHGVVDAAVTINCAGLQGDVVDRQVGINTYKIQPRKGQYCVFDKTSSPFFNNIIFPIPTEKSKGIALFKSVYDNVVVGPTADDVEERINATFNQEIHLKLCSYAKNIMPKMKSFTPVGHYCGLRPATQFKDYQIQCYPEQKWISVGGIRSTGVSGSLGIGQYLANKLISDINLEPSKGKSLSILDTQWKISQDGKSVLFDESYSYLATHPIFTFGHKSLGSYL